MTAKEKAEGIMTKWQAAGLMVGSDRRDQMVKDLTMLIKEQDRDTRHACMEAVSLLRGQMGEGGDPFTAATAACVNVYAV